MASTVTIDLRHVARGLDFPLRQVQAVVELLDEGNTVPFITRYRKDQTGGLDEEQIREIQDRLAKMRLLAERKQTVLRSIEAQGKLTEKLAKQILSATTTKRLEDLYLPFKPKKQTLATLARSRGLEEFATEILEAAPSALDLDARARDYANPDRQVPSAADALLGAGHILAEQFSERADLRQRLREILQKSGKIVTTQIVVEPPADAPAADAPKEELPSVTTEEPAAPPSAVAPTDPEPTAEAVAESLNPEPTATALVTAPAEEAASLAAEVSVTASAEVVEAPAAVAIVQVAEELRPVSEQAEPPSAETEPASADAAIAESTPAAATTEPSPPPLAQTAARRARERERAKAQKQAKKEAKKRKAEERRIKAFRDYFSYSEDIKKIPPHRILAINRAERAKVLRVKIECDLEAMAAALEEILIPPGHPHADYLRGCARDALNRLVLPALEREARRELTDRAETHAVTVFARNLRNLLLQPPVHNRRVLAADPGFKSGCKLAALDQFGNLLGHDVIYLVGSKPERKEEAKQKALSVIRQHELTVVAIGNGTACRETEEFFAELLSGELKDQGAAYVIVNEAGASVYSTSQLGREELPDYDATLRGAVSIGRRLLDPLSELVKIEPANIGVGLYQHDVKAKHLEASLDEVVESCVNYVGVDVNTASPALLRYVSGLNQLTARRVYEYRREHGPFRNREQLREVAGFGEATFIQAAGFLKIAGGDNPLDATWIHPESYALATKVMERFGAKASDLIDKEAAAALSQRMAAVKPDELAKNLAESGDKIAAVKPRSSAETAASPTTAVAADDPLAVSQGTFPFLADHPEPPLADRAATIMGLPPSEAAAEPVLCTEPAGDSLSAAAAAPAETPAPLPAENHPAAREPSIGALTLRDILAQLARPGRDPREDLPPPVFKQGIIKLEDLTPGMELTGTVLNVVDFGCFVDIGMHDSGLVHVSRMADRFIRDPHEVVAVGDVVHVWVMEVDKERRRVSLTMVRPGSERPRRPPHSSGGRGEGAAADQAPREGADGAPGPRRDRPPRSGQDRRGRRPPQQQGGAEGQPQAGPPQGGRPAGGRPQGGRPYSGRPQGGRPDQGRRPQHAPSGPAAGGPAGPGGPASSGGPRREDRRGPGGPPSRRPRFQGDRGGQGPREFKPKPGPVTPITDAMKKGKEPMRTFGDLMQFFGDKSGSKSDDKKPPAKGPKERKEKPGHEAFDPPAGIAAGETANDPPTTPPAADPAAGTPASPGEPTPASCQPDPQASYHAEAQAPYKPEEQASAEGSSAAPLASVDESKLENQAAKSESSATNEHPTDQTV